mmetsp:Transcript_96580/g.268454  ORF Transcript_96580/g.268454 Transcript_96580/m.268454 type:complete len:349 (-) Transcript_96580:159-1205(-)
MWEVPTSHGGFLHSSSSPSKHTGGGARKTSPAGCRRTRSIPSCPILSFCIKNARWRLATQAHRISASFASARLPEMRSTSRCKRSSSCARSAGTFEGSFRRSLSRLDDDRASSVCSQSCSWHCLSCRCRSVVCISRLCSCLCSVFRDVFSAVSWLTLKPDVSGGSGNLSCRLVGPKTGAGPRPWARRGGRSSSGSSPGALSMAAAAARSVAACMLSIGGRDSACCLEVAGGGGPGGLDGCDDMAFSNRLRRSFTLENCMPWEASSLCSRRARRSLMPSCWRALEISSLSRPRSVSTRSIGGALSASCLDDPLLAFLWVPLVGLPGDSAPLSTSGQTWCRTALSRRVWM